MAKIQCKMCGGRNDLPDGVASGECPYCGSLTTFPKIADTQTEHLYARAEHFRQKNDFDKAVAAFESILDVNSEDPEAWWGLLISKYGIEYVEDPATHERIPTCHRVQFDSILADSDYLNVLKYASGAERDIYEKEAKRISEIQKGILKISAQEKPYDVFICYKEMTEGGSRTKDSTLAQEIYYMLTNQGLNVFFSRITMEDKIGQQYEPYIFAALNSAKVMLVIGSKREHFEAVWVKNEWSRYLALKKKDRSRLIIPCYKDMDPYDLPEELSLFQSQDMGKIGFIQDLLRGIMKVVNAGKSEGKTAAATTAPTSGSLDIPKIMKRIAVLMEQQDWEKAKTYCDKLLESDPENPELYLMMSMISLRLPNEDALWKCDQDLSADRNFRMALKFASPERKKRLEAIQCNVQVSFYLMRSMQANRIPDLTQLSFCNVPLSKDEYFQKALHAATPERREELRDIQRRQVDYFLGKCMDVRHVSNEADLAQTEYPLPEDTYFISACSCTVPERQEPLMKILSDQVEFFVRKCVEQNNVSGEDELTACEKPLSNNRFFALALQYATPERKNRLLQIQYDQADFFLSGIKQRLGVDSFEQSHVPLETDEQFQTALRQASPERREELRDIQKKQYEFFIRRCMDVRHVSNEADLAQTEKPLPEDNDFNTAYNCASPERQAELRTIQKDQVEFFVRKCMERNNVSSEEHLAASEEPLSDDRFFSSALQYATPERKDRLRQIQFSQSDQFLRKCMKSHHVKIFSIDLAKSRKPLKEDPLFCKAQTVASPEQEKNLEQILEQQEEIFLKRRKKRKTLIAVCITVVFIIISALLWRYRLIIVATLGNAEAQYQLGAAYENGKGVKRDENEAMQWYRKAAAQGHARAAAAVSGTKFIDLSDGVELEMILIETGSFEMSAKDGENDNDEVPHRVTLTKEFYIGRTEVTQAQWKAVMRTNPSFFKGDDLPVEQVSWNNAMAFCEKLNSMGKAPRGWKFSLPTETQWEYAARGGKKSKEYKYSGSNDVGEMAWYDDNSRSKTHPVGRKKANELGLYDMSGNVWEWCLDDWNADSSQQRAEFTRDNNQRGSGRAIRGGSWGSNAWLCRSAGRNGSDPGYRKGDLGFRVALVPVSD